MFHPTEDFHKYIHPGKLVHLAGIGGVSMCALAEVLQGMGVTVQGSDMSESDTVKHLRSVGIPVAIGHSAENLKNCDAVIRTAAIHDSNPEIAGAVARGIPVYERAQAWGAIMQGYRNALCVSGTHGKTTTTSMATHIFMAAQADPTEILLQPVGEKHLIRPAMVRIGPVRPEGGHFNVHLPRPDRDRPVLQPGWDGIAVKQCKHLLRPRGGGHVPISRCAAQQRVPHAAAHGIGGEARILQPLQHISHRLRQHGFASPHVFSSSAAKYRQKSRLHGRKRCIIIVQ